MSASVECFAETSDERLKSFSISIGLTISSVIEPYVQTWQGEAVRSVLPGILDSL